MHFEEEFIQLTSLIQLECKFLCYVFPMKRTNMNETNKINRFNNGKRNE